MKSGLMTVRQNDPDNFIEKPDYFCQYIRWILHEHKGNNIQTSPTQVSNSQLYKGSNSHMSTYINIFTYNRPVKCNVHILNFRKAPVKVFDLVIIKNPKTDIIIPLWPS